MPDTGTATLLLAMARAFRPRIIAERERIEAGRRLSEDLARELSRAGFFRMLLPEAYGGLDLPLTEVLEVYEELARADASVAWCVWNGNTHWTTAQLAPEVARRVHANPDVIIANSTRASGQAQIVEGGYRVTGRWALVSGCELASWMILLCVVHRGGQPCVTSSGAPENRFMLCPATDCEIIDTWTAGGLRGTGSHDVVVSDVFVPESYGSSWTDPFVLPSARYRVPAMSRVLPGLGAMGLGIARGAIETLVELAVAKVPARTTHRLCEDGGAQTRLSQAEALVRSGRLFLFDAVDRLWQAASAGHDATMEARAQLRLATSHAVSNAAQAVDLAYTTGGANSLYATCPIERAFRDVHAITSTSAFTPRHREHRARIVRSGTGHPDLLIHQRPFIRQTSPRAAKICSRVVASPFIRDQDRPLPAPMTILCDSCYQ
jgi:alkylation response protein AidB-like acyl-CoA dehydrogenase